MSKPARVILSFEVDPAEGDEIRNAAKIAGVSISRYLRERVATSVRPAQARFVNLVSDHVPPRVAMHAVQAAFDLLEQSFADPIAWTAGPNDALVAWLSKIDRLLGQVRAGMEPHEAKTIGLALIRDLPACVKERLAQDLALLTE